MHFIFSIGSILNYGANQVINFEFQPFFDRRAKKFKLNFFFGKTVTNYILIQF